MTASYYQPMPLPAGHSHSHDLHAEGHFTASETVRDVVIGMSDGLTVPFALAAGLSGAVTATRSSGTLTILRPRPFASSLCLRTIFIL
jgi:hypothetical protein